MLCCVLNKMIRYLSVENLCKPSYFQTVVEDDPVTEQDSAMQESPRLSQNPAGRNS